MKKVLAVFLISLFMLTGCTSPVEKDLLNYINIEISSIREIEVTVLEKYEDLVNNKHYSYGEVLKHLESDIIPQYELFYEKLNQIKPVTDEVMSIHQLYISGAQKQIEALNAIKEGLKKGNNDIVSAAGEIILESELYMDKFTKKIRSLADKYEITYSLE